MKNSICALILFIICGSLYTEEPQKNIPDNENSWKITPEIRQGIRFDHLKWSIAGPHHKPNIISELDFRSLKMSMTTFLLTVSHNDYVGKFSLGYGYATSGKQQDSDYLKNNRRGEFLRSYAKLQGSYCLDNSIQFGKQFRIHPKATLTPSIGYACFMQNMKIHDAILARAGNKKLHQKVHIKDSYRALWHAPYLQLWLTTDVAPSVTVECGYTFLYPLRYYGVGHWNNRKEVGKRFVQKSSSFKNYGHRCEAIATYRHTKKLHFGLGVGGMFFTARDGSDRWKKGPSSPFKKATRSSFDLFLSASYSF